MVVCPTTIVLNELKKSNLFSVCSVFSCCKNGSDNFQVLLDRANTISLTFAFKTFVLIMDLCICTGSWYKMYFLLGLKKFFKDFIYLFLERGEGKEKERNIDVWEKHWWADSNMPPTGDLARNTDTCPDWELNQPAFGPKASAQSIEPHQSGKSSKILSNSRENKTLGSCP